MELEEKNPDPKYGKNNVLPLLTHLFSIFEFSLTGRRNGNNDCKGMDGCGPHKCNADLKSAAPSSTPYFSEFSMECQEITSKVFTFHFLQ